MAAAAASSGFAKRAAMAFVVPRVGEFVAAVGDVGELHVEFARCGFEAAGLIAELGGEESDGFCMCYRHRVYVRHRYEERFSSQNTLEEQAVLAWPGMAKTILIRILRWIRCFPRISGLGPTGPRWARLNNTRAR